VYRDVYRGRRVMITGGVGFIGSNLARALVDLGADVLLVDSLIPEYGGNLFNIRDIEQRVRLNIADVRMQSTMEALVRDRDVLFNLAGQVSHIDSMRDPYTDLEINCRAQLSILEACRKYNRTVRGPPTSTASTRRPASTTTCSTTTCSTSAPAPCA
jgi:UDP-glucose 4-epimerase